MNDIIQRLADNLILRLPEIKDIGLYNGKMGIVLFYYELSRFLEDKTYEDIAGNILDEVINDIINIKDNSFENGLSGIGWGINYLINNSFIEAESDVLNDIELYIFNKKDEIISFDPQFSFLPSILYLSSKTDIKSSFLKYGQIILDILDTCNYHFLSARDNINKPLEVINPILHFLILLEKEKIYEEKVLRLIWRIYHYLDSSKSKKIEDKFGYSMIFYSLSQNINNINFYLLNSFLRKDKFINRKEIKIQISSNFLWQSFLFLPKIKRKLQMDTNNVESQLSVINNINNSNSVELLVPIGLCWISQNKFM